MSDENVRQKNQCVCRHNQTGFCKYGDQCQKQHVNQNCSITPCKEPNCIKRHPKKCKYFSEHSFCKFKNNCAYIYKEQKESVELKNALKEISRSKDEIEQIKINMKYQEETKLTRQRLKCA